MLKAFAITSNLTSAPLRAMPLEQRHHWLSIRYHYGDREQTPVRRVAYRLVNQANPDLVLEGFTDQQGRLFEDAVMAGHYDLLLVPEADATADTRRKNAIKHLQQNLANIRLHLQQHPLDHSSEPAPEMVQFWRSYLNEPWQPQRTVTPWIDYLQSQAPDQPLAPDTLLTLREALLLLARDTAHKNRLADFMGELPLSTALPLLTDAFTRGLDLPHSANCGFTGLQPLIDAAGDTLRQLTEVLKLTLPRRYARVSVNQNHQVQVLPQGTGALAINHFGEGEPANLLAFSEWLAFADLEGCVNPVSGETHWQRNDFHLPGELPLTWRCGYRSHCRQDTGMGNGWYHPLSARLHINSDTAFFSSDGVQCTLPVPEIGTFSSNRLHRVQLYRDSGSRWLVKFQGRSLLTFSGHHDCRLERITHSQGHFWQCEYDADSRRLRALQNDRGTRLMLQYQDTRISEVLLRRERGEPLCLARYHYDAQGRLTGCDNYEGGWEQYRYDDDQLAGIRSHRGNELELTNKRVVRHGRHWQIERLSDNNNSAVHVHLQDQQQNRQQISLTDNHCRAEHTNTRGGITRYQFDPDSGLLRISNPAGHEYQYFFDGFGNLTACLDPAGGGFNLLYNQQQQPIAFCDAMGNSWECEYDSSGLIREARFPSGLSYRYEYGDSARPVAVQINSELRRELVWNPQGELTYDSEPPADLGEPVVATRPDELHRSASQSLRNPQFDPSGLLTACSTDADSAPGTSENLIHYHRDAAGRLAQVEFPDGRKINCSYNRNGQLTEVTSADGCRQFEYDADGRGINQGEDPQRLLATLDPQWRDGGNADRPASNCEPVLTLATPYRYWELDRWENLFTAFSHEGHQDALFTLRLWQALLEKSWLPFSKGR